MSGALVHVECPECGVWIPVTMSFTVDQQPSIVNRDATFVARATPDLTDVWAHAWTHTQ